MAIIDPDTLHGLLTDRGPVISLYLPINSRQRDVREPEARLQTLINEASALLDAQGLDTGERETLLEPIRTMAAELDFATHRGQGVALFAGDRARVAVPLPAELPPMANVGDVPHLKPLLRFMAWNQHFYVLALSAENVRLFRCTAFAIEEVVLNEMPEEVQASLDSRAEAGVSIDQDMRIEALVQDPHRIAYAVRKALGTDPAPVLLAAEPQAGGHFVPAAHLPQLLEDRLVLNPFGFTPAELHGKALAMLQPQMDSELTTMLDHANARLGTAESTVAIRLEEILQAAEEGRVDSVLVAEDEALWGHVVPGATLTARGTRKPGDDDLVNLAAVLALRTGGRAFARPRAEIPRQSPAVALLRY